MTDTVETERRFTRRNRCPICGGAEGDPRGVGERCIGYISRDGKYARCSRIAGALPQGPDLLWPHPLFSASNAPDIEATYDYRDEAGRQLFQVVRRRGKKFLQRRLKSPEMDPNVVDSWEWNTKGVRMVLYKLPELIVELRSGTQMVFICEGEKDVDNAWNLGLVATCNPRGAGKWKAVNKQARDLLIGGDIRVIVVQDNDDVGRQHARQVAAALGAAILVPPEPCKDLTDWILLGATMEMIVAAAEQATKIPVSVATTNGVATNWVAAQQSLPTSSSFPAEDEIKLIQFKGQNAGIVENIVQLLKLHPDWNGGPAFDAYADRMYWSFPRPEPVAKYSGACNAKIERSAIQAWCLRKFSLAAGLDVCEEALRVAAKQREIDSLMMMLDTLPPWDGVPRLDRWVVTYLGCEDNEYTRTTGWSWLRACIERAYAPGIVVDMIPVLVGPQGSNKNFALETLFKSQRLDAPWLVTMGEFSPDKFDFKKITATRWIIHDDEFKASDKKLVNRMKSWVSQTNEQWMAKWDNDITVKGRRALLICSTNEKQHLYDHTGNRRWVRWDVGEIDVEAIARDQLQLFAEARASTLPWRTGLNYKLMEEMARRSEITDPLADRLLRLSTNSVELVDGRIIPPLWRSWASASDLAEWLSVPIAQANEQFSVRLGLAVSSIGGEIKRTSTSSGKIRFYKPPKIDRAVIDKATSDLDEN